MSRTRQLFTAVLVVLLVTPAAAQVLAEWNFDNEPADAGAPQGWSVVEDPSGRTNNYDELNVTTGRSYTGDQSVYTRESELSNLVSLEPTSYDNSLTTANVSVAFRKPNTTYDPNPSQFAGVRLYESVDGTAQVRLLYNGTHIVNYTPSGTEVVGEADYNEWVVFTLYDIDPATDTFSIRWASGGNPQVQTGLTMQEGMTDGWTTPLVEIDDSAWMDRFRIGGTSDLGPIDNVTDDPGLELNTRSYLEHNTSAPYTVVYNDSGDRRDVTGDSTVTSNDTSVVTVNEGTQTINATSDVTVNNRTFVEAEYTTDDGETLTARQNVTVANETVENIDILPTWNRVSASLQDTTLQTIIVATMAGVAAGIFASSFASIAAFVMVMSVGWLAGRVGNGMIIATWMIGSFVGLNVALNINRRIK